MTDLTGLKQVIFANSGPNPANLAQKTHKSLILKNKVLSNKGEHKLTICIYKPIFLKVPKNISLLNW